MIGIRVDANEKIASGHVMRCLSIADALFLYHARILFITSDSFAEELITARGYDVIRLQAFTDDKEGELKQLRKVIDANQIDILLVDSYQVTFDYLKELHEKTKLVYIDDLNSFDYPVDVVINYSIDAESVDYPPNKKYLLGTQYSPLRKQFDITKHEFEQAVLDRDKGKKILIMTGASDPYNTAEKVIREILNDSALHRYQLLVVKGRFWRSDFLDGYERESVSVLENVDNMAELMIKSSMAVSAAGSTLYELCACGVPTVFFTCADNQLGNAQGFIKKEIMEYAGDVRENENVGKTIVDKLLFYHANDNKAASDSKKMFALGCGKGSERIAEELMRMIKE